MPFTLPTTMMKTLAHPARNAGISLAVALAAMTPPLQAETLTVCAEGGCDYATIQAAIDAASNGDVIEVAAGRYLVDETIDTIGKSVRIHGAVDPAHLHRRLRDGRSRHQEALTTMPSRA